LLRPKYVTFGFRTKDLQTEFNQIPKTAKINYELNKLKERGLVKKIESSNYYVVTKQGWIWMWSVLFQKDFFVNHLLSISFKQEMRKITNQTQKSTTRIRQINTILNLMYQDFWIVA
jgi:predicted transcriptional regulator